MKTAKKTNDVIQILKKQNIESLFFMDVGAKDRLDYCSELATITEITGFEPNPIEFQILENKYHKHPFKSLHLKAECLSDVNGEAMLHIMKHASMSSLLPSDMNNYQKHFGTYRQFETWKDNMDLDKKVKVTSIRLDDFHSTSDAVIDYLKIDTQGSELKVLEGAEKLLNAKRVSLLKIEVSTIAVYQNQAMFSDIDLFMRNKGYVLVDFMTYRENYKPVFGKPQDKQHHFAPCGDAIYMADASFFTVAAQIKSAILLLWLGYYSLGTHLLKNSELSLNDQKTITAFQFISPRSKIKQLLINVCPPLLLHWLKK